jgi:hypothetical protein
LKERCFDSHEKRGGKLGGTLCERVRKPRTLTNCSVESGRDKRINLERIQFRRFKETLITQMISIEKDRIADLPHRIKCKCGWWPPVADWMVERHTS